MFFSVFWTGKITNRKLNSGVITRKKNTKFPGGRPPFKKCGSQDTSDQSCSEEEAFGAMSPWRYKNILFFKFIYFLLNWHFRKIMGQIRSLFRFLRASPWDLWKLGPWRLFFSRICHFVKMGHLRKIVGQIRWPIRFRSGLPWAPWKFVPLPLTEIMATPLPPITTTPPCATPLTIKLDIYHE